MSKEQSQFRNILKGTALFGGTQLFTMLTNIVRGKLVAMILGSYGMGISSLIMSTIQPIVQFFSFGIPMASVSCIGNAKDDREVASKVVAYRRCMFLLALLALVFTVSFSPLISQWTFSDEADGMLYVIMASVAVLLTTITNGEIAILQSVRALRRLARCNIVGPICGLAIGVPIFYFFGVAGIVPSIIIQAFVIWAFARWNTMKLGISATQSWSETFELGRTVMVLGGTMMLSGLLVNLTTYVINAFVNNYGNTADVGLYQGANIITLQCIALVFSAFATDYYPHLSQVSGDREKMATLVNQEVEVVMSIMSVVAATLIVFAPLVVRLLLTEEFMCIIPVIQIMSLAFLMKALYFPMGYIVYAKGDKFFYLLISGLLLNAKYVLLSVLCYMKLGVVGLGLGFAVSEVIDMIVIISYIRCKYHVGYSYKTYLSAVISFVVCLAMLLCHNSDVDGCVAIACNVCLLTGIVLLSVYNINKRVDIMSCIKRMLNKKNG